MALTLEDAKRAKREAEQRLEEETDDYGFPLTPSDSTVSTTSTTEPADPEDIDHDARRATRIAPSTVDPEILPTTMVECGCGECYESADPLADENEVWRDVYQAVEGCSNPRPMTVERARDAYITYQLSTYRDGQKTSRYEEIRGHYGKMMQAERDLLDEWDDEVTTALLSLRLRPIENIEEGGGENENVKDDNYGLPSTSTNPSTNSTNSTDSSSDPYDAVNEEKGRRWLTPVILDNRLHNGWGYVRNRLRDHLDGFEWEYLWIVSATDDAATPHLHVYVWIRDSDDEITVDHVSPAVESFVRNVDNAYAEDHPIEEGESDAAVIKHDPPRLNSKEEILIDIFHHNDDEPFHLNTAGFAYLLTQRPHWALAPLVGEADPVEDLDTALEGAAIAHASPNKWIYSSEGLDAS